MTMKYEIDISYLLKDYPINGKLWSPVCGVCLFKRINEINSIIVYALKDGGKDYVFDCFGRIYGSVECLLFPSREAYFNERECAWKNYKVKHFEAGEKVLVKYLSKTEDIGNACDRWKLDIYSHFDIATKRHYTIGRTCIQESAIIKYKGNESLLGKEV